MMVSMQLEIDGTAIGVVWEDNQAARDLRALVESGPVTITAKAYGGG